VLRHGQRRGRRLEVTARVVARALDVRLGRAEVAADVAPVAEPVDLNTFEELQLLLSAPVACAGAGRAFVAGEMGWLSVGRGSGAGGGNISARRERPRRGKKKTHAQRGACSRGCRRRGSGASASASARARGPRAPSPGTRGTGSCRRSRRRSAAAAGRWEARRTLRT
jgi:hypothetical protein